ncbi:MAG: hypothetical protein AAGG68_13495 [Bacteroidota bacterium]
MKITEEILWNYIEGNCNEAERLRVEKALKTDVNLKKEWLERKLLHEIMEKQELESPSMRFTKNVMEALPKMSNYAITKKQLRPFLFVILGSFLLITFLSVFIETPADNSTLEQFNSSAQAMSSFFLQEQVLFIGLALGAVSVLLLLDQFLQKRLKIN